jgi:subtilisin family serine protease
LLATLAAAAATVVVGGLAFHPESEPTCNSPLLLHPHHMVHARLAPGFHGARPLFTHLPAGTRDERTRWFEIDASAVDSPAVEESFEIPDIEPMVDDTPPPAPRAQRDSDRCPITTPAYDELQGYVGPAPAGIDAPFAWSRGIRGANVQFADVEGGWNSAHEDLPAARMTHVAGKNMTEAGWAAHGTAVLGEIAALPNGKGVTGLAPDIEHIYTSSIAGESVADAIDAAAEKLRAGDVLLIELQGVGPRGRYVPVELWDDNYAAIRAATDRGVVVVEAAGNGGEDLDRSAYKTKLSRTGRDSGAIMVGAGGPPRPGFTDRTRLDFSNFGSRVDVQGWGRRVATLDYGDLQACDDRDRWRHYTGEFSGTSSASPIVAGAAILVESAHDRALSPRDVRRLLTETGTAQTGDTREHIGPRPDLARALR